MTATLGWPSSRPTGSCGAVRCTRQACAAAPLRGSRSHASSQLEASFTASVGLRFAVTLQNLGGAVRWQLRCAPFPQSTEQLLHIDKFLERERALPVRLPTQLGELKLSASETFGELDVRSLLRAFAVPNANAIATGWGGGRLALYVSPQGDNVAALALRWDSTEDADEWRDAVLRYLEAAFPGSTAHDCPPLDHCWSGSGDVASGVLGTTSIFASAPVRMRSRQLSSARIGSCEPAVPMMNVFVGCAFAYLAT